MLRCLTTICTRETVFWLRTPWQQFTSQSLHTQTLQRIFCQSYSGPRSQHFVHKNCIFWRHYWKPSPFLQTMKLESKEFQNLFTPELLVVSSLFEKHGYELRIAGGAVRDLLLGKQPNDLDFATTATPDQMKAMFESEGIRMINMKGDKHGTVTCRINDKENFEVTTLRIDVKTDGRHAEVEFTKDWELDALRRDLTINSMFLGLDGTLYDYFNGQEDLREKEVKFVGDAVARIQEDYLRILRYFRFYGRIATNPDRHESNTLKAIQDNMHGLAGISGERLWVELKKIACGRHAASLLRRMLELGVAQYVGLPEKPNVDELKAVWGRCHDIEYLPMTLLSALLNDENEVYQLQERVKMSKDELKLGLFITRHRHDNFGRDPFRHCQDMLCDTVGKEPRTKEKICELLKYLGNKELHQQFSEWIPPKFPVSGHRLIERGVEKGPKFAKTLNALRQKWKESAYTLTEDELLDLIEDLKKTIS